MLKNVNRYIGNIVLLKIVILGFHCRYIVRYQSWGSTWKHKGWLHVDVATVFDSGREGNSHNNYLLINGFYSSCNNVLCTNDCFKWLFFCFSYSTLLALKWCLVNGFLKFHQTQLIDEQFCGKAPCFVDSNLNNDYTVLVLILLILKPLFGCY